MAGQLAEVWDDGDDWTGVTSTAERRKRQNRLSQRAFRKRRHLQRLASPERSGSSVTTLKTCTLRPDERDTAGGAAFCMIRLQNDGSKDKGKGRDKDSRRDFMLILCPQTRDRAMDFAQKFFPSCNLGTPNPNPSDLPLVIHLNYLNALAHNAFSLAIPLSDFYNDEGLSPFCFHGPATADGLATTTRMLAAPEHLRPTALQHAVVHHPWVDLLPIPGMRDNILRGLAAGLFDEDELCGDLAAVDEATSQLALFVWGEPSDIKGWEISAGFLRKWGVLVQGCNEALEATNFWRQKRGERKLELKLDSILI